MFAGAFPMTAPYVKMENVTVKTEIGAEWPQPYSIFTAAWPGADPAEPPSLYLTQKRMVEGSDLHSIFFSLLKEYNHHECAFQLSAARGHTRAFLPRAVRIGLSVCGRCFAPSLP
jgi:hypothetical protein